MKTFFFAVAVLAMASFARAQSIPTIVSYQGYITQNGTPIDGPVNIVLTLYNSQSGTTQVWSHTYSSVSVSKGYYTVQMDFSQDWQNGSADFHGQYWLDATVNGADMGRVQMTGSPFAVNAILADSATRVPQAPIGTIVAYAGQAFGIQQEKAMGWFVCDGSLISAADFPDYKSAVGSIYGTSTNGDSAYLPDYRGLFLRGVNGTRSDSLSDPDVNSRFALNGHGQAQNQVGSIQSDQFKQHDHGMTGGTLVGFTYTASPEYTAYSNWGGGNTWHNENGGSETRPKNAYVYWLIKVR